MLANLNGGAHVLVRDMEGVVIDDLVGGLAWVDT